METTKLTIRLPKDSIAFAKQYAQTHRMTLTELFARHIQRLRLQEESEIHPLVEVISGVIPADVDAEMEYHEYLMKKHQ